MTKEGNEGVKKSWTYWELCELIEDSPFIVTEQMAEVGREIIGHELNYDEAGEVRFADDACIKVYKAMRALEPEIAPDDNTRQD